MGTEKREMREGERRENGKGNKMRREREGLETDRQRQMKEKEQ